MPHRTCVEPDCDRPAWAVSLCKSHYARARRATLPPCSVEGCDNRSDSAGMCAKHYARTRKHGDPHISGRIDHFTRVEIDSATGCWLYTGPLNHAGYGTFGAPHQGEIRAHRAFYAKHVAPIPKGMELDHLCNVRRCVNPDHLEVVTREENMRRARLGSSRSPLCRAGLHDVTRDDAWIEFPSRPGVRQCVECYRAAEMARRGATTTT